MVKSKMFWRCSACTHVQSKWTGQCRQCEGWNTFLEDEQAAVLPSKPCRLSEISVAAAPRTCTHLHEFDRLLGGGIVEGSLILVGGDPGIGKSTLMLQAASAAADQKMTVLYVSGEESIDQTSLRAERLGIKSDSLFLFSETNLSIILAQIEWLNPHIVIIDSIQIIYKTEIQSAPGSISQVRESTAELMHLAKRKKLTIFLIGHVTKSGEIAGPRVLEHLVDTVLYFEGDKQNHFRILRAVKNRFGPTDEIAVFQMGMRGLQEIPNPSQIFLEERKRDQAGSAIIPTVEGSRPILIEVQALVSQTSYATPARRSAGIDPNRLPILLAVLEKRMGYQLYNRDVFVSVVGGMRIHEPGIDLGIMLAVASSLSGRAVEPDAVLTGEVGLGGEIRGVSRIESRLKEAVQMGFRLALIPKKNREGIPTELSSKIKIIEVDQVEEAIETLLF